MVYQEHAGGVEADLSGMTDAEDNPWYRLMTVHGAQSYAVADEALHLLNRVAWHYWVARLTFGADLDGSISSDCAEKMEKSGWSADAIGEVVSLDARGIREIELVTFKRIPKNVFPEFWRVVDSGGSDVDISPNLSSCVFDALVVADGYVFPVGINCDGAIFGRVARFAGCLWLGDASFKATTFRMMSRFDRARFEQNALFDNVMFLAWTYFRDVSFERFATFPNGKFDKFVSFDRCNFEREANFSGIHCGGEYSMSGAVCLSGAVFSDAVFGGPVSFERCKFHSGFWARKTRWTHRVPIFFGAMIRDGFSIDGAQWPALSHDSRKVADAEYGALSYLRRNLTQSKNSRDSRSVYREEMRALERFLDTLVADAPDVDTKVRRFVIHWFGRFCEYGTNIGRPVVLQLFLCVLFASAYAIEFLLSAVFSAEAAGIETLSLVAMGSHVATMTLAGAWPLTPWPEVSSIGAVGMVIGTLHSVMATVLWIIVGISLYGATYRD